MKPWLLALLVFIQTPCWAKPSKVVVGFSATWFDGQYPIVGYQFKTLSHIARSFIIPKPDGSLELPNNYFDLQLKTLAKQNGVKLLAAIGGQASNANHWLGMARNPQARQRFFNEVERLITQNEYDGVDIDWEPSALTDADQATYTDFMVALRQRFPKWVISTDLGGGEYWAKHVSWKKVAQQVDFINLMAYDFCGPWTGHSGHNSNLGSPSVAKADTGLADDEMVHRLTTHYGVPPSKLNLGLAFYGIQFSTDHLGDAFKGNGQGEGSQLQYYELLPLVQSGKYNFLWDRGAQVPYLEAKAGGHTVSYEDPLSIAAKCQFVRTHGLAGVLIWNLGADAVGGDTPLLDSVARSFGVKPYAMPAPALRLQYDTLKATLADARKNLGNLRQQLQAGGDAQAAAAADLPKPAAEPVTLPTSYSGLLALVKGLERELGAIKLRSVQAEKALAAMPVKEAQGAAITAQGESLLVDDFENGMTNRLQGSVSADFDSNNLGTTLLPKPFELQNSGCLKSPGHSARIYGHFGKSQAPWPYAELLETLQASGLADISAFKTLRFWAKGNGKNYDVNVVRDAVKDGANFRFTFKADPEWKEINAPLDQFEQPDWTHLKLQKHWKDVKFLSFHPSANMSDEDYDLWIDQIELVKQ